MPPLYNFMTQTATLTDSSTMAAALDTSTSLKITLTPTHDASDRRTITLTLGNPVNIGRSSRSDRGKQLSFDNALFNCPVVSRMHAELELLPALPGTTTKVVITDTESMHGTFINGKLLERKNPTTLMDGDNLRFGNRVERVHGKPYTPPYARYIANKVPDSHEGFAVTFRFADPLFTNGTEEKDTTGRFTVPDDSDDFSEHSSDDESERSEAAGEDDDASVVVTSSANTTPDKVEEGSPTKPISITANKPGSSINDVIDLDAESFPRGGAQPTAVANATVVQDSLDEANAFVADSYAVNAGANTTGPILQTTSLVPADVFADTTTLAQINGAAPGTDREASIGASVDSNAYDSFSDDDSEDNSYAGDYNSGSEEEMDDDYVSDNAADADSDSEHSEDEGPDVMSSKRQPSPQLGSLGQAASKATPTDVTSSTTSINRHYDPVRGFQEPSSAQGHAALSTAPSTIQPPYKARSYANPTISTFYQSTPTDYVNSSRWDMGAGTGNNNAYTPAHFIPQAPNNPCVYTDSQYPQRVGPVLTNQHPTIPKIAEHSWHELDSWDPTEYPTVFPSRAYEFPSAAQPVRCGPTLPSTAHSNFTRINNISAPSFKPTEPSKLSIMDLVQDAATQIEQRISPRESAPKPAGSSKRKIADISDYTAEETGIEDMYNYLTPEDLVDFPFAGPESSVPSKSTVSSELQHAKDQASALEAASLENPVVSKKPADKLSTASKTSEAQPPPAKRARLATSAKRSTAAKIARTAGWMTLGSAAGAVATIGFLCSPLAEKLIEMI